MVSAGHPCLLFLPQSPSLHLSEATRGLVITSSHWALTSVVSFPTPSMRQSRGVGGGLQRSFPTPLPRPPGHERGFTVTRRPGMVEWLPQDTEATPRAEPRSPTSSPGPGHTVLWASGPVGRLGSGPPLCLPDVQGGEQTGPNPRRPFKGWHLEVSPSSAACKHWRGCFLRSPASSQDTWAGPKNTITLGILSVSLSLFPKCLEDPKWAGHLRREKPRPGYHIFPLLTNPPRPGGVQAQNTNTEVARES